MKQNQCLAWGLALALTACGGSGAGGGGSPVVNTPASIGGTSAGATTEGATSPVSGMLSITDPDAGQAVFKSPVSLAGTYGAFTFNDATGAWTYLIDNSKAATLALNAGQVVEDVLRVTSSDGTATQDIRITISGASGTLVFNVPAPVYAPPDAFAAEKLAVFNRLNDDRARCGFGKVAQSVLLDKAAQAHADYLALNKSNSTQYETQGLLGYLGFDPSARLTAFGYKYSYWSEIISQQIWGASYAGSIYGLTEKSAINNLRILYGTVYHLAGAMRFSTDMGIGIARFSQDAKGTSNAKMLVIDLTVPEPMSPLGQQIASDALVTFPCQGISGVNPIFSGEDPDPFPDLDWENTPYGHPIYLMGATGSTLSLTSGSITLRGGASVPVTVLTKDNDPQLRLFGNQIFLVPTQRLADNSTYDVQLTGTHSGMVNVKNPTGTFSRAFSFTTSTFTSD
jgi:VCBS repeat-containing protein